MELSLIEIWNSMGLLARAVAIMLVGMGLASLGIAIERMLVLRRALADSARFAKSARPLLEAGDYDTLLDLASGKEFRRTPLARLTRHAVETYLAARRSRHGLPPAERVKRELARQLEMLSSDARSGMGFLASTGSTAPFIGLFGTVIGIITAFQGIAAAGGGGIAAVSAGIAEALIVTAVGLFVAISSVLLFNYLTASFNRLDQLLQHAAGELLDTLEGEHEDTVRQG
ncbi:MAG: tolQ protein [Deltaproteobacteria bacterium]|nr:MAG: tolQ protein [Deltaproteobacteria bacterium]